MAAASSSPSLSRKRPSLRQVLAVDAGARRIKLLTARSDFGRPRIVRQEMIDLQAEGLVSADEIKTHLASLLQERGNPPIALTLPQHVCVSQVVDLEPGPESEVEKQIAEETIKLSGVAESRIVHNFVRLEGGRGKRQQFWVTFCQDSDVRERIHRLGVESDDLCEITTTASALVAAHAMLPQSSERAILVDLGAQATAITVLLHGQGRFAASFQMGGDFFTRGLARILNCAEEKADALKRSKNLLHGPDKVPEFAALVDGWMAELKRQLAEWFQQNASQSGKPDTFEILGSGGGFGQPGLLEYLDARGIHIHPWPTVRRPRVEPGFEVAFGTALQALGYSPQPVSLLPDHYQAAWRKRVARRRIDLANAGLALICFLICALVTWQKAKLISDKEAMLAKVRAGQESVDANDALTEELVTQYESFRPIFAGQRHTIDTLKMLSLLQQARSNRNFWFVLVTDQSTYFSQPVATLSTNRPARTNLLGPVVEPLRFTPPSARPGVTNIPPARPGYIAEVCVPGDSEGHRQTLSSLVSALKQQPLFSRVDLLSEDLRRNLADPKLVVADRHFALALDFAESDFQQPVLWKPRTNAMISPKRAPRPAYGSQEHSGGPSRAANPEGK